MFPGVSKSKMGHEEIIDHGVSELKNHKFVKDPFLRQIFSLPKAEVIFFHHPLLTKYLHAQMIMSDFCL